MDAHVKNIMEENLHTYEVQDDFSDFLQNLKNTLGDSTIDTISKKKIKESLDFLSSIQENRKNIKDIQKNMGICPELHMWLLLEDRYVNKKLLQNGESKTLREQKNFLGSLLKIVVDILKYKQSSVEVENNVIFFKKKKLAISEINDATSLVSQESFAQNEQNIPEGNSLVKETSFSEVEQSLSPLVKDTLHAQELLRGYLPKWLKLLKNIDKAESGINDQTHSNTSASQKQRVREITLLKEVASHYEKIIFLSPKELERRVKFLHDEIFKTKVDKKSKCVLIASEEMKQVLKKYVPQMALFMQDSQSYKDISLLFNVAKQYKERDEKTNASRENIGLYLHDDTINKNTYIFDALQKFDRKELNGERLRKYVNAARFEELLQAVFSVDIPNFNDFRFVHNIIEETNNKYLRTKAMKQAVDIFATLPKKMISSSVDDSLTGLECSSFSHLYQSMFGSDLHPQPRNFLFALPLAFDDKNILNEDILSIIYEYQRGLKSGNKKESDLFSALVSLHDFQNQDLAKLLFITKGKDDKKDLPAYIQKVIAPLNRVRKAKNEPLLEEKLTYSTLKKVKNDIAKYIDDIRQDVSQGKITADEGKEKSKKIWESELLQNLIDVESNRVTHVTELSELMKKASGIVQIHTDYAVQYINSLKKELVHVRDLKTANDLLDKAQINILKDTFLKFSSEEKNKIMHLSTTTERELDFLVEKVAKHESEIVDLYKKWGNFNNLFYLFNSYEILKRKENGQVLIETMVNEHATLLLKEAVLHILVGQKHFESWKNSNLKNIKGKHLHALLQYRDFWSSWSSSLKTDTYTSTQQLRLKDQLESIQEKYGEIFDNPESYFLNESLYASDSLMHAIISSAKMEESPLHILDNVEKKIVNIEGTLERFLLFWDKGQRYHSAQTEIKHFLNVGRVHDKIESLSQKTGNDVWDLLNKKFTENDIHIQEQLKKYAVDSVYNIKKRNVLKQQERDNLKIKNTYEVLLKGNNNRLDQQAYFQTQKKQIVDQFKAIKALIVFFRENKDAEILAFSDEQIEKMQLLFKALSIETHLVNSNQQENEDAKLAFDFLKKGMVNIFGQMSRNDLEIEDTSDAKILLNVGNETDQISNCMNFEASPKKNAYVLDMLTSHNKKVLLMKKNKEIVGRAIIKVLKNTDMENSKPVVIIDDILLVNKGKNYLPEMVEHLQKKFSSMEVNIGVGLHDTYKVWKIFHAIQEYEQRGGMVDEASFESILRKTLSPKTSNEEKAILLEEKIKAYLDKSTLYLQIYAQYKNFIRDNLIFAESTGSKIATELVETAVSGAAPTPREYKDSNKDNPMYQHFVLVLQHETVAENIKKMKMIEEMLQPKVSKSLGKEINILQLDKIFTEVAKVNIEIDLKTEEEVVEEDNSLYSHEQMEVDDMRKLTPETITKELAYIIRKIVDKDAKSFRDITIRNNLDINIPGYKNIKFVSLLKNISQYFFGNRNEHTLAKDFLQHIQEGKTYEEAKEFMDQGILFKYFTLDTLSKDVVIKIREFLAPQAVSILEVPSHIEQKIDIDGFRKVKLVSILDYLSKYFPDDPTPLQKAKQLLAYIEKGIDKDTAISLLKKGEYLTREDRLNINTITPGLVKEFLLQINPQLKSIGEVSTNDSTTISIKGFRNITFKSIVEKLSKDLFGNKNSLKAARDYLVELEKVDN